MPNRASRLIADYAIASCIDLLLHAVADGGQAHIIQAATASHVKEYLHMHSPTRIRASKAMAVASPRPAPHVTGPLACVPRRQLDDYRRCEPRAAAHST
jgi:hypothetical protein